ncbi:WD40 repeat-like protein [Lentinula aff. detonsa]|uniref:WD40 repeat-like protein n=1 Tax=Lentinula aff. detonsa TaxID=2804958 RepID=A0AA38KQ50_9AGAR|nr:WD40 repeat-like protein [Lentinula aff. detonsa]KAJ3796352.1 WD40 repeat-like protein [Lentinula aff. detonsa]
MGSSVDHQFALPSPPIDSVSKVQYSPTNPNQLLVSSWDTTVKLYDVGDDATGSRMSEQKCKFDHRAAVLACCFSDAEHGFSGGLDTTVRYLDFGNEKTNVVGSHSDAVSSMVYSKDLNALISASWDRTLRLFDPRAPTPEQSSHENPERIYHIDLVNNTLVVAMASRLFHIYDVRNMKEPSQQRESSLKYMTRSLACMLNGEGYATASVEGRIAVEYFDPSPEAQEKKYAFKCHRQTIDGVDHVWPVNALAFHPIYNTFASAGSDGTVSVWDHKIKKRLRQYPKFNNPVSSIAFNCDGSKLAIASCYTWDEGEQGARVERERPQVWIKSVGPEVKPKDWQG